VRMDVAIETKEFRTETIRCPNMKDAGKLRLRPVGRD
jgi:hypothetical protein